MSLLSQLKKNSGIKGTDILSDSTFFDYEDIPLDIYVMNLALSGSLRKGLIPGLTIFAGKSKHGKSILSGVCGKGYMNYYEDAIMIFYDSEFGTPESYFNSLDIDTGRVLHCPLLNIEGLKHDLVKQLEFIKENHADAKVFIFIDSFGNVASKKEAEDALEGKSKADMTRAKELKSLTRIITPYLRIMNICCVAVAHTYDTMEMFSKAVVSGGCLGKGTRLIMSDNSLKNIEDIQIGDYVKTMQGDCEVTATWNPETLEEGNPVCYKVTFDDDLTIVCSNKHLFMHILDGEIYWQAAEDLYVGDVVERYLDDGERALSQVTDIVELGNMPVYDITVKGAEHYLLENNVVTHNTGIYYSADNIFIMGRQQEKEGKDVTGFNLIMNVEKSRYCVEKSKFPIELRFNGGINRYTGLLDVALKVGHVVKPSNGWYSRVLDGETEDKKWRAKDTNCKEFWQPLLDSEQFHEDVERAYSISSGKLIQDEDDGEVDIVDVTKGDIEFTNVKED